MSILVAMVHEGTVWIGSDTQTTESGTRWMLKPKWYFSPPWTFGVVGTSRGGTVMAHKAPQVFGTANSIYEVCHAARAALLEDGFKPSSKDVPEIDDFDMLAAKGPQLWWIGRDFSGDEVPAGAPVAIGSGSDYALGAMMVMQESGKRPEAILRAGLRAAMRFSTSCGGEEWVHAIL